MIVMEIIQSCKLQMGRKKDNTRMWTLINELRGFTYVYFMSLSIISQSGFTVSVQVGPRNGSRTCSMSTIACHGF